MCEPRGEKATKNGRCVLALSSADCSLCNSLAVNQETA